MWPAHGAACNGCMTKQQAATARPSDRQPDPPPARSHTRSREVSGTPLPHERDQAVGAAAGAPGSAVIGQAKRDIDAGLVDTDMRATPGLDAERRDQLVPTPTRPPPTPDPGAHSDIDPASTTRTHRSPNRKEPQK